MQASPPLCDHFSVQRNPHAEVGSFVLKMCLGAAVLMLMRTPLIPITLLGDALHKYFPDLPTSDMYGKVCEIGGSKEKYSSL